MRCRTYYLSFLSVDAQHTRSMIGRRGLDGLTVETLRASRASWWDDAFTRRLLDLVARDGVRIVDVGCGLSRAAHALLPHLSASTYVGVDLDEARVHEARVEIASAPYASRVELKVGRADELPVESASVDIVLTVMTLQHLRDVAGALRDFLRVLRSGGRIIAAEPDNLAQLFYLDGRLDALTAAIKALSARAKSARHPADLAIGPRVPGLLMEAGFENVIANVHAVHGTRIECAEVFLERVGRIVRAIADQAGLAPTASEIIECDRAIAEVRASLGQRSVLSSHVAPVFVCAGTRP